MPSLTYAVHQEICCPPPSTPAFLPPSITSFSLSPFFTSPFLLASFSFVQFPSSFPYFPLYFPSSLPSLPRSLPSLHFSYLPSLFHLHSFTPLHLLCHSSSLPLPHPFSPFFTSISPPLPSYCPSLIHFHSSTPPLLLSLPRPSSFLPSFIPQLN